MFPELLQPCPGCDHTSELVSWEIDYWANTVRMQIACRCRLPRRITRCMSVAEVERLNEDHRNRAAVTRPDDPVIVEGV